jgi:hypothetical protein
MPNNRRVFWAVQGVVIGAMGVQSVNTTFPYSDKTKLNPVRGLQSVGITTTFNLEQVFEMGQLSLYENLEEVPDVREREGLKRLSMVIPCFTTWPPATQACPLDLIP